uniref:skin secretory protein xP2-like n=1 Tax=Halichoerus grypus TaxID=9711 RepID=UPI001659A9A7|nr:skin secretory protein xP2-like [Halichoerus grypus]
MNMLACCFPKSGGCRLKKERPANAVPRWGCPIRAPRRLWPFGRKARKTTDEIGRRLADTHSIYGTWGVTPQDSPGAAAPPSQELEPAPTPSAALEGGVVPAATSGGDPEPAGDPAPAHGEPDGGQEGPAGEPASGEPAPAPAPVPARAAAPAPAPNCGPAPGPDPAPALDPDPSLPLPVPLFSPLTQILPRFLDVPSLQTLSLPLHLPPPLPLLVRLSRPLRQLLPLPLPLPGSLFLPLTQLLPLLLPLPLPEPITCLCTSSCP